MNAWHQGRSQGRKGKFTDLFFFLSFFLSFVLSFSLSFPPTFLFTHSCFYMSIFMSITFLSSMRYSLCLPTTCLSHLYISFILRNICPSVPPKDCHRERKPLVLSMTEDIATKPSLLSNSISHSVSASAFIFSQQAY